jgi:hypothetical protein
MDALQSATGRSNLLDAGRDATNVTIYGYKKIKKEKHRALWRCIIVSSVITNALLAILLIVKIATNAEILDRIGHIERIEEAKLEIKCAVQENICIDALP